jgi:anti-sigma B factor antagonist
MHHVSRSKPSQSRLTCETAPIEITFVSLSWWPVYQPEEGPVELKLSVRTVDGIIIVDCKGRIVFGEETASLRDTVRRMIVESKRIVLNLADVNYIDSGGLGTLVALYATAQNAGGSIKLANLTPRVDDVLQVTKLVTIFQIYDSEEAALQSYQKGAAA